MCIITSELIGLFKNGGIGTSMTGLAETLAKAGFPVTVLYTGGYSTPEAELVAWRTRYAGIDIRLDWICFENIVGLAGATTEAGMVTPWLVWRYLQDYPFDVIQFNDCIGDGALALAMKRLGAAFADSVLCVALHSPSQWVFEAEHILPETPLLAAMNHNERLSTRCADLLWSPSYYLLDWIRANGFAIPEGATYVQQYAIPSTDLFGAGSPPLATAPIAAFKPREIAFFGRLEERKGLRLFCEAIGRMHNALADAGVTVAFLGKPGTIGTIGSNAYIAAQARGWRCAWRIETGLGQAEAIAWLRDRQGLAVIASPVDNSPCTVYEALAFGIPFVATRCGGIPEIIAAEDQGRVLFDHDAASLSQVIEHALRDGIAPARPAQPQEAIRATWAETFANLPALARQDVAEGEEPRAISAIVDHVDDADLDATLASLRALPGTVRITIIDRTSEGSIVSATDTVVTGSSPASLKTIVDAAYDTAVLLIRSGVTVEPEGLAALLDALRHPHVDGLMPTAHYTRDAPQIIPPMGSSAAFAFFQGVAITGGLVVKGERLAALARDHALIPHCEFLGLADLAVVHRLAIWPFAVPVWRVAAMRGREDATLAAARRIAVYGAVDPVERYYINAIGYGATIIQTLVGGRLMLKVLIRRLKGIVPTPLRKAVKRLRRR